MLRRPALLCHHENSLQDGKFRQFFNVGAREQNRTADLFITSDLALNAVLTVETQRFQRCWVCAVLKVICCGDVDRACRDLAVQ
jgi:hypothetical protein